MKKTIVAPDFELTNLQRRHLGLQEASPAWERVPLKHTCWILFFDGDIIRKIVARSATHYYESDVYEITVDNRSIVLPKTKRGKPKKLNFTALQSFSNKGIYFSFSDKYILLANYTTDTTFFQMRNQDHLSIEEWLRQWVEESTEKDLEEIEAFKTARRQHQKYKEGDFFAYRIGRHKWGFGRILLDLQKRSKMDPEFMKANPGFLSYMGKTLMIMVYRHISDSPSVDLDELRKYATLPVQAIMDNHFYYGEYPIIGNSPVSPEEWEPLISLDAFYDYDDDDNADMRVKAACLQYGLISVKSVDPRLKPYLVHGECSGKPIHDAGGSGFHIDHYDNLEKIIEEGIPNESLMLSNENFKDLRMQANFPAKAAIFGMLRLDPYKSYAENLRDFSQMSPPS